MELDISLYRNKVLRNSIIRSCKFIKSIPKFLDLS